uniref:Uncharacterized protein n=1 Tax=Globisporangium ultimum (strain ATCC 200006 / CBS 805.95 / DAOM BR144) TaxID=431595 RepID=K3X8Y7_GLOUD
MGSSAGAGPSSTSVSTGAQAAARSASRPSVSAPEGSVESLESTTPGITRIRKGGNNASGKVVEVDSTIARIIGSDWGDRRNQTVSLPMRIYWIIFGVVLANGAYTYFAGKDESYLVEKLQEKVDEKLGVVETNEFVVMADPQQEQQQKPQPTAPEVKPAPVASSSNDAEFVPSATRSVSVFGVGAAPTTTPFFGAPPAAATAVNSSPRPRSKVDLQDQLQQLRTKQNVLQQELQAGKSIRAVDDIEFEIRLLDQQKEQVKRMIKRL